MKKVKKGISLLLIFSLCLTFLSPVYGNTVMAAEVKDNDERIIAFFDDNANAIPNSVELTEKESLQLHPKLQPEKEDEKVSYTYESDNNEFVTVSADGKVQVLKSASKEKTEVQIMVTAKEESDNMEEIEIAKATFTVVVLPKVESVKLEKDKNVHFLPLNDTCQLKVTVLPEAAPQEVLFNSSDKAVATVDANGLVIPKKAGETTITVKSKADQEKSDSIRIVVIDVPVDMVLDKTTYSMMAKEKYQIDNVKIKYASGIEKMMPAASLTYRLKDANSKVVELTQGGLVTASVLTEYPQTATVIVKYQYKYIDEKSKETYAIELERECVITVTKIPVKEIKLLEDKATLKLNQTYQIYLNILPADATEKGLTFKSANEKIAKVSSNGLVTAKDIGETTISIVSKENSDVKAKLHITVFQNQFNVTDFGANGTDDKTDTKALQKVLDYAQKVNKIDKNAVSRIDIPKGKYIIDNTLIIYSNTNLMLDKDAVIKRASDKSAKHMLRSYVDSSVKGYKQCNNIKISGGVWDGNANGKESSNCIYFGHAQNITIENTTVKNTSGAHLIEFAGVKNAIIDNVELCGYVKCKKKGYTANQAEKEAIQLDYCSSVTAPAMKPYDNIHCENITIQNCNIHDYASGIGSHMAYGNSAENITISNNKFTRIADVCISLKKYKNVNVTGNQASKCSTFLYASDSTGSIHKNSLKNSSFTKIVNGSIISQNGITISNKSNFTVTDNLIQNFKSNAICIWNDSKATVKSNKLYKNGLYGIRNQDSTMTLAKNKFSKNKKGNYDTYKNAKIKSSDDIEAYYIAVKKSYQYKGRALKPTIKIKGLKKNKNFKVYYKNNKKRGKATIVIKGKGKIKGTRKITFRIK